MNRILLFVIACAFVLAGCETTREITFVKGNSGIFTTTTDMSGLIGMAKMSGQGKEMESMEDKNVDTTISLDKMADSLEGISPDEKALIKKGKLAMQLNMADEKFIVKLEFPFSDPAQISRLEELSSKLFQKTLKEQMAATGEEGAAAGMPADSLPKGSIEDYFATTYSKGVIEKKLNKEKYANVENDEGMKALKEKSGMGVGNNTLIINLPKPAKKAEGKNVKLSDDKKKVTITTSTEDFFDDAAGMEFRIEY